jgi:hypothetical protein
MEYSVRITLTAEQEVRLRALTEEYNRVMGASVSPAGLLESLIAVGSVGLVNERMQHLTEALVSAEEARRGE